MENERVEKSSRNRLMANFFLRSKKSLKLEPQKISKSSSQSKSKTPKRKKSKESDSK